jgi:hypothetical protein
MKVTGVFEGSRGQFPFSRVVHGFCAYVALHVSLVITS